MTGTPVQQKIRQRAHPGETAGLDHGIVKVVAKEGVQGDKLLRRRLLRQLQRFVDGIQIALVGAGHGEIRGVGRRRQPRRRVEWRRCLI